MVSTARCCACRSPLGIESLPREQALPLIDAYHDGALALGGPFGVWGAIALDRPDPDDVDRALGSRLRGAFASRRRAGGVEALSRLRPCSARLEQLGAPLLVHPGSRVSARSAAPRGRGLAGRPAVVAGADRATWPSMQAAWLAFVAAGRANHPRLRVVFSMLAGLAPLQAERLSSRGGPSLSRRDPLTFYDTSSYGPLAPWGRRAASSDAEQLLYGSDRPVVEPERARDAAAARLGSDRRWHRARARRALGRWRA